MLRALAEVVVLAHLAFVIFAVFGGLLALRWPRAVWLHLPAVAWAALVEFAGWTCPLTPLENWLRARGRQQGYATGFLENYLLPALYPAELTREIQVALGALVLIVNLALYAWVLRRLRR